VVLMLTYLSSWSTDKCQEFWFLAKSIFLIFLFLPWLCLGLYQKVPLQMIWSVCVIRSFEMNSHSFLFSDSVPTPFLIGHLLGKFWVLCWGSTWPWAGNFLLWAKNNHSPTFFL
jgi:hypothetical protein